MYIMIPSIKKIYQENCHKFSKRAFSFATSWNSFHPVSFYSFASILLCNNNNSPMLQYFIISEIYSEIKGLQAAATTNNCHVVKPNKQSSVINYKYFLISYEWSIKNWRKSFLSSLVKLLLFFCQELSIPRVFGECGRKLFIFHSFSIKLFSLP